MYKFFVKRIFDILFSLVVSPFILVVILIFAPIIYFTDKGPIFYNAPRIGKNGKIFKMFKLRSMYVDAPDIRYDDGFTYNGADDPRMTKIGKFIRLHSIDELPQMFNVLFGQMSLIGPRPDTPVSLDKYTEDEKEFLSVRPGLTGYNQVYYRNFSDDKEKIANDIYYAKNCSFLLDLKIFFKTFVVVFGHKNVYRDSNENLTHYLSESEQAKLDAFAKSKSHRVKKSLKK
ncbi:MAG: sugar transferase [Oscillospiraceae bacterium]|nr:sugar transferase [Candidatus Equicaccousia limihippi]